MVAAIGAGTSSETHGSSRTRCFLLASSSAPRSWMADLRARAPSRVVVEEGMVATCDGRLVTIVLENLLANAGKFTGKRTDASIVVGREDGGVFFVRDNRAGFDGAQSEHMCEPFRRLHAES